MSTALTKANALQHLDVAEGERAYLLAIMAEQLGIPARDSQRPDVQALIANAVERNRDFGWKPGVHMHVQSFMSKIKDDQNRDTGEKERKYTLVDGEKAWKDSIAQWRTQYGVILRYQRKPMTREELETEIRSMGFEKQIPPNAYGMWCRLLEHGVDDPRDPDFPMWSTGIWFGSIKAGSYFNVDNLPTGVSPRDVAIRRADKRAAMQSSFGLLELDRRTPEQRSADLAQELRREAQIKNPTPPDTAQSQRYVVEDDGDILWATDPVYDNGSTVDGPVDVDFSEGSTETPVESTDSENGSTETRNQSTEAEDNPFNDEAFSPYAEIIHNPDYMLSDVTKAKIEELRELQVTSTRKMSALGYKQMRQRFFDEQIIFEGPTAMPPIYLFEALTATHLEEVPGVRVGKPLMELLNDDGGKAILKQVAVVADTVYEESLHEN